jgi:FdrA protein
MSLKTEIRRGIYYDSVVLMQLQRALLALPGVQDAGVVMATPANMQLLAQSGLLTDAAGPAAPDDLLIVIKGDSETQALGALAEIDALLARRRTATTDDYRPKSLSAAVRQLPEAAWVLVSVPGRYAAGVAREALALGKHVFLYSDNISLEEEIALKRDAQARGLLVMGPDCGTAIVNGIGLGFANRVRRGRVGLVAASGTGLQATTSRIDELGGGISHALGTGGRDLKAEIGGITASQAIALLARDPETAVIVLISKPPAPEIATRLIAQAARCGKPVVINFIGYPAPGTVIGQVHLHNALEAAGEAAWRLSQGAEPARESLSLRGTGFVRGLFSGGTLAYETVQILQTTLYPLYTNTPIRSEQALPDPLRSQAHTVLDLGGDEFTVGRLHPMMNNDLRLRRLAQEAADPEVGLILLDLVLGEGAHPDPASELAPAIAACKHNRPELEILVAVVGTEADPQHLGEQMARLSAAGAHCQRGIGGIASQIAAAYASPPPAAGQGVDPGVLSAPLAAINVGVESFFDSLTAQGAACVQVDWKPPAGGNERMAALLARLKK